MANITQSDGRYRIPYGEYRIFYGDNQTSYGEYRICYGEYPIAYGEYRNPYGENHIALWRKLFWYGGNSLGAITQGNLRGMLAD
jgi:hypothetical protein